MNFSWIATLASLASNDARLGNFVSVIARRFVKETDEAIQERNHWGEV